MNVLITDNPKQIQTLLYNTLDKLIIKRIEDGAFTDQEEAKTKSYFSQLEGLETLLIPFVNLPRTYFWEPLKNKYSDLVKIIIDDIDCVLSANPDAELPPEDQGEPYFEGKKGSTRRIPYWTSECSSFTLSVLTNFLELREKFGLPPKPSNEEIINVIKSNLKWVDLCKKGNGWSWTNDSTIHPWPTWSLLDTFDEMLDSQLIKEMHNSISQECGSVIGYIVNSFNTIGQDSYLHQWNEKIVKSRHYDIFTALDLSRLMTAVSLHGDKRRVYQLAQLLFTWASETDFSKTKYKYPFSVRSDHIDDSGIVPSVFRALILMAGVLKPKIIKQLDKYLDQNHEVIINKVYSKLMETLISKGEYEGLWGVKNRRLDYELYYTERTSEALTEFLVLYESKSPITDTPSYYKEKKEEPYKATAKKKEVTVAESIHLPILEELTRNTRNEEGKDIFSNKIIIYVLHFLNDLPPFIKAFYGLGCSYEDMFFLVKTYAYSQREELHEYFKSKKSNVFIPEDPLQATFDKLTEEILKQCISKSESENKQILIIEDGGYFAPLFHSEKFKNDVSRCDGAVEQTTKGYRRDMNIEDFQFPIYGVASSKLKLFLEAPEVGETLQENIIDVFKKYEPNKAIHSINALVLGIGNIGRELATALDNKRIVVYVYDNDKYKRMEAELSRESYKNRVLPDLNNLSLFDIIIGTSGETSLKKGEDFWNLKHNVILASGSSERLEFNLSSLEEQSQEVEREEIFTNYTLKRGKKLVRLLCDGEPINFALSGGISKATIDPVYAEMFWSAVGILTNSNLEHKIHAVPDKIESEVYRLYKKFQQ